MSNTPIRPSVAVAITLAVSSVFIALLAPLSLAYARDQLARIDAGQYAGDRRSAIVLAHDLSAAMTLVLAGVAVALLLAVGQGAGRH